MADMMRILFCCEHYSPSVGGIQEVMRQIAERLVSRGHEVTVATSRLPDRSCWTMNGVVIKDFPISGNCVKGMQGDVVAYQQWVLSGAFDVIMINMAQQWTLDALIPVLKDIRCRKILIPCGFSCLHEPSYAEYYRFMPDVLGQFDHLIFHASDYRDIHFAKQYGMNRLSIIPNGACENEFSVSQDQTFRKKLGILEDELLFLTVGAFTADKGFTDLLKSYLNADFGRQLSVVLLNSHAYIAETNLQAPAVQLNAPEAHATRVKDSSSAERDSEGNRLYGFTKIPRRLARWFYNYNEAVTPLPFREEMMCLIERIHQENSRKRVILVDLPRPQLVQAYMHADLFVFASRIEYSPLVLFESIAAGTPFLSSHVGNANEVAQWTGAGVIAPSIIDGKGHTRIDEIGFARCWEQLAHDRARLCEFGRTGKRNWAAKFTWDKLAQEYEELFRHLAVPA